MAFTPSKLRQIHDCLDRMAKRLDEAEERRIRDDAEDKIAELREGNTQPTPTQPFSDSPPERIHGEGREDQDFWGPPKPKPPIPIKHI
jgi:hypothetical protein